MTAAIVDTSVYIGPKGDSFHSRHACATRGHGVGTTIPLREAAAEGYEPCGRCIDGPIEAAWRRLAEEEE